MSDSGSVDGILEFLRRNKFTRAEAALRTELTNRSDLNGFLQNLTLRENDPGKLLEEDNVHQKQGIGNKGRSSRTGDDVSNELIVKEIECGTGRNGSESKWKNVASVGERNKASETVGTGDKKFTFSKNAEDTVLDLYSLKFNPSNGSVDPYEKDAGVNANSFPDFHVLGQSRFHSAEVTDTGRANAKAGEEIKFSGEMRASWLGSTSKAIVETKHKRDHIIEPKELNQQHKITGANSKDDYVDNPWSRTDEPANTSVELWKDCSVKTVFPFSEADVSTSYDSAIAIPDKREGKKKAEINDIRAAIKEQVDEVGRSLYFGRSQESSDSKVFSSLGFPLASDNQKEELPRLPPVKIKSEDKPLSVSWEEKFERDASGSKIINADNTYLIGSFLDVPIGQEINSAGGKRPGGGSWLSVSQGIAEDTSDLVSGFATIGDGLSESVDYPNEYWDSDEYDDDDDVGYMRQPIEDETWFLAHEIDYPSDNEKGTGHGSVPDPQESGPNKDEEDDQSFAEEDSYLSGERYFESKNIDPVAPSDDQIGLSASTMYGRTNENDLIAQYDGQLMDEEELKLMRAEPVWQGFVTQTNELVMLGDGKIVDECGRPRLDDICMDDDQHGSVRSIGVGINSDAADFGSEVRESLVGGSSEGDLDYFHDRDVGLGKSRLPQHDSDRIYLDRSKRDKKQITKHDCDKHVMGNSRSTQAENHIDGGFSFPPPRDGQLVQTSSSKSLWSNKGNAIIADETDNCLNTLMEKDDMLASWRQKSSGSSRGKSSRDEDNNNGMGSQNSSPSSLSNYGYADRCHVNKNEDEKSASARLEDPGASIEDEEAAAVQEQVKQIKAQEEEFETFNLKIVHRKNRHVLFLIPHDKVDVRIVLYLPLLTKLLFVTRTGFEEDKNFHVVLNSVIAGRYHVTEYLGSAAFSKAIQAHDLHTGMDVCVKIIKNNKDFFDQSLDEIKLLKFVNKHDPGDKYHILRLYDYFYYREHLLIVCELLKANLYEFHKFNRESGGEVYFTMPRLQSITIQCLEALQFLHGLGLIHCDLKPENILVKSYSRCEVKVIDLGSSCFETDHLCSYVQSRSYRAPEVILGLPYDKKIDIWSLGCILSELCTGNLCRVKTYQTEKKIGWVRLHDGGGGTRSRLRMDTVGVGRGCMIEEAAALGGRGWVAAECMGVGEGRKEGREGIGGRRKKKNWSWVAMVEVLFQNDSPATLLARVIGIIGSINQDMLAKGRDTYKYFTKNHMLYERNQDSNRLEYLIPKKSSLRHRLLMGDQGFIDFVAHLLEINPKKRPSAAEALKHPWLSYPYEPISS
ncbi:hypothetical protein RJ639_046014 [Escallonia herrerae]|uniref:Protein kinase domain-containing protein n=2 Tax=Pentapetalae TaxID=1437201 RepID=A0AA89AYX9_9ASTE|nr:hypothetical protein RJ639_046014 [Escallonia herrerae]